VGVAASLARRALIEAVLGRSAESRAHGLAALDVAIERGDRWNETRARAALGCEALSRGDAAAAAEALRPAVRMLDDGGVHHPNMFRVHGDLVEALARIGEVGEAAGILGRFARDAERTRSPWACAVAARCEAILTDDAVCEQAFAAAVRAADVVDGFERGRTLLAHGERLRRLRRIREARAQLRVALETFEGLPAAPWVERTRTELRASGERLRPRSRAAHEELTPQELQVAFAAADGLTNKEIAARLFLSPKTVEFHLTRVYRKLAVRSRAELVGVLQKAGASESTDASLAPLSRRSS
jgi:DNA-binding CsgD family transcriptional regulator